MSSDFGAARSDTARSAVDRPHLAARPAEEPHGHPRRATESDRRALLAVLAISASVFVVELAGGLLANSLALVADAGHVFADVAGVGLALGALWIAGRPASPERTFGFYRVEIIAAVVNALILLGVAAFVLVEAWRRLTAPPEVETELMLVVAVAGLVANAVSLRLLHPGQSRSLNIRGAYLEVLGDLLGSLAVVAAALVIAVSGRREADAVASIAVALLILPRTWHLLREAVDVLLEAAPRGMDLEVVRRHILEVG
ncbi:MAG TPA: cation diffusion facilitator family transporter, partial [Candidatus Limnocylindrales bacterium]|nr:cation diffusion facilitator family transporter [Candidatus Limnocylindrales bacterium]